MSWWAFDRFVIKLREYIEKNYSTVWLLVGRSLYAHYQYNTMKWPDGNVALRQINQASFYVFRQTLYICQVITAALFTAMILFAVSDYVYFLICLVYVESDKRMWRSALSQTLQITFWKGHRYLLFLYQAVWDYVSSAAPIRSWHVTRLQNQIQYTWLSWVNSEKFQCLMRQLFCHRPLSSAPLTELAEWPRVDVHWMERHSSRCKQSHETVYVCGCLRKIVPLQVSTQGITHSLWYPEASVVGFEGAYICFSRLWFKRNLCTNFSRGRATPVTTSIDPHPSGLAQLFTCSFGQVGQDLLLGLYTSPVCCYLSADAKDERLVIL